MIRVVRGAEASDDFRRRVVALCDRAYDDDLTWLFGTMDPVAHVVAESGPRILAHAMWVERFLQVGDDEPVRSAYVEFVATEPDVQGQGWGSAVMRRLQEEIAGAYELAGLCTGSVGFYTRLGWRLWEGPLSIRLPDGGRRSTPHEVVMVLDPDGRLGARVRRPLSVEWREGEEW